MERDEILRILRNVSKAFNVRINYFSRSKSLGYKSKVFGRPIRKKARNRIPFSLTDSFLKHSADGGNA